MKRVIPKLLAALLLASLTGAAWQFRFERSGPPLSRPFEPGLPGWDWKSGKGRQENPDSTGALTLRRDKGEPAVVVERVLGPVKDTRFLHARMETQWDEVARDGEIRWATARAILFGKLPGGRVHMAHDHGLLSATGSAPWHREEAVFELVPDSGDLRFSLEHWGSRGTLRVRNVEISAVRQRAWFRPAATGLVLAWVLWAAWWIAPLPGPVKWLRAVLAGVTLVGATWLLVFPQPRFAARSLVGAFQLGAPWQPPAVPAPVTPPPPATPAAPPVIASAETPAPTPTPPPAPQVQAPAVAPPPPPAPPKPEARETRTVDVTIRRWRDRFNFLHFAAFAGFGLALFALARPRVWPIAAFLALASEALPNYQQHQPWDRGDFIDLLADGAGLALAAGCLIGLKRLRSRWSAKPGAAINPSTCDPP